MQFSWKQLRSWGNKQDNFLEKIMAVSCNSSRIAELGSIMDTISDETDLTVNNSSVRKDQLTLLKTENKQLWGKLDELEAYKRRWNLCIAGIPEVEGENVKMAVMEILWVVSPGLTDVLQSSIDVTHRLSKKGLTKPHHVIVQFTSRVYCDQIWADAKARNHRGCVFFIQKKYQDNGGLKATCMGSWKQIVATC